MWKYITKENLFPFILSLELLTKNWDDEKKIKCLYSLSNHPESHYKKYYLNKKDGGKREILAPDYILKHVQKNINKNILSKIPVSNYATAYFAGADIKNNAAAHIGQKKVLKMDIKDFFRNIDFETVYNYAFSPASFPPAVRMLLTSLCCYNRYLPQGAPTSAALSNIILKPFDEYIGDWCAGKNITYTRYSDDMTFSGEFDADAVKNKVKSFLEEIGFELNLKKTSVFTKNKRQSVTGLTVNEKVGISKAYKKKLRQEIYYCKKFGVTPHLNQIGSDVAEKTYLQSLLGKIQYVLHINPQDTEFQTHKKTLSALIEIT